MAESAVLIGQKAICDYLRIGRRMFYALVKSGAPITKMQSGWVSHKEVLESYFIGYIKKQPDINDRGPA